ncbi:MAG TPA: translation initiation factor IF-2 [Fimbriimonadaceae bacterium]|nr:translation initiation factor IF-2 [Fimbriimonadaceae bacterium]
MQRSIAEIAEEFSVAPGLVTTVLEDLGVGHEQGHFDSDGETFDLIKEAVKEAGDKKVVRLAPSRTPRDVAAAIGVADKDVLKTLIKLKVMATLTTTLDDEVVEALAQQFGYSVEWGKATPVKPIPSAAAVTTTGAETRPPVVTILGHVDHGKTSLLDYIRKTNVVAKEHGGITQHIGAYQVKVEGGLITFLDTPGHAAFTAMRARGAQVTDIAILVVAADDGIMPQTIEAINHAKSADVPIIVAVNKIDVPGANPGKVLQQMTEHELVPEAYGGQVIVCNVSAHTGEGIENLLEMILLQAEVLDLKADARADLEGVVVEAQLDRGRGPVATVLVESGTLRVGDVIIAGNTWGKVKAMNDWSGERLKEAGPSTPVEVLGLNDVPGAGDRVEGAKDERAARDVADGRVSEEREAALMPQRRKVSLKDLVKKGSDDEAKDLNLIVKADVQGSVEAVRGMLEKLEHPEVNVRIIHTGVGPITESDVLLASAAGAICVGFNVKPEGKTKTEAERQKVEIRTYKVIYELVEDIEKAIKGMLEPKFEEEPLGTVEIRAVFKLTKAGVVAGCHVTEGKVARGASCRVHRGDEIVFAGKIASLRNVKEDVREMTAGQDCGVRFEGWTEFKAGDVIEAYQVVQVN